MRIPALVVASLLALAACGSKPRPANPTPEPEATAVPAETGDEEAAGAAKSSAPDDDGADPCGGGE